jgi:hypothetical protein
VPELKQIPDSLSTGHEWRISSLGDWLSSASQCQGSYMAKCGQHVNPPGKAGLSVQYDVAIVSKWYSFSFLNIFISL